MRVDLPDDWERRIETSGWAPSPLEQTAVFSATVIKMIKSWKCASEVPGPLDIVFTQPPGPVGECVFVGVEHAGIRADVGYWRERDGQGVLRIPRGGVS